MESSPQVTASAVNGVWNVSVGGQWNIETPWPENAETALRGLAASGLKGLRLEAANLGDWDSSLLVLLVQLVREAN